VCSTYYLLGQYESFSLAYGNFFDNRIFISIVTFQDEKKKELEGIITLFLQRFIVSCRERCIDALNNDGCIILIGKKIEEQIFLSLKENYNYSNLIKIICRNGTGILDSDGGYNEPNIEDIAEPRVESVNIRFEKYPSEAIYYLTIVGEFIDFCDVCLSDHLYLSIYLSIYQSIYLSFSLPIYLFFSYFSLFSLPILLCCLIIFLD
jgi:hypothetical protein